MSRLLFMRLHCQSGTAASMLQQLACASSAMCVQSARALQGSKRTALLLIVLLISLHAHRNATTAMLCCSQHALHAGHERGQHPVEEQPWPLQQHRRPSDVKRGHGLPRVHRWTVEGRYHVHPDLHQVGSRCVLLRRKRSRGCIHGCITGAHGQSWHSASGRGKCLLWCLPCADRHVR